MRYLTLDLFSISQISSKNCIKKSSTIRKRWNSKSKSNKMISSTSTAKSNFLMNGKKSSILSNQTISVKKQTLSQSSIQKFPLKTKMPSSNGYSAFARIRYNNSKNKG